MASLCVTHWFLQKLHEKSGFDETYVGFQQYKTTIHIYIHNVHKYMFIFINSVIF